MSRVPNVVQLSILSVGLLLARFGLIDRHRASETTRLAWPRIVTGFARMSKSAVDIAMIGVAIGSTAIAGLGFAQPFWAAAWVIGAGIAAGTIALVSQNYGAGMYQEIGLVTRSSALLALLATLPVTAVFWTFPTELIGLLSDDPEAVAFGSLYLQLVSLGIPFAALNIVGSQVLVGADDSYTPMKIRVTGAVANVGLSGVLIFGLDMGIAGAAVGTVLASAWVTLTLGIGLVVGRLPLVGTFPVQISPVGTYTDLGTLRDTIEIGLPLGARNLAWNAAQFPMLALLALFGSDVVAGYVVSRRIWGLLNTPGWGFGTAATSLVGQQLGKHDESEAELFGREIIRFALTTYLLVATVVVVFAEPIVMLFIDDPADPAVPIAVAMVYASCIAVPLQGVAGAAAGTLNASGDTKIPFVSRVLGMFCLGLPLVYLGATTPLGLWGVYLAIVAETFVPAVINYWRFHTNKWKRISRRYRSDVVPATD